MKIRNEKSSFAFVEVATRLRFIWNAQIPYNVRTLTIKSSETS